MLVLEYEPFLGFRPDDLLKWLEDNRSEAALALALSAVQVKAADVWDEYGDSGDRWALYAAEEWSELEECLTQRIEAILEQEGSQVMPRPAGSHYRILPFMNRNGYRDGSGWWIKE